MKINDSVPYFLEHYEPSLQFLRQYYEKYDDMFREYFLYHCQNTDDRLTAAIDKYPDSFTSIKEVHQKIAPIISKTVNAYERQYNMKFPIEVNLLVGGYGSNGYTERQFIPNITFALEQLSPQQEYIEVLVAHEFGHALHNILSEHEKIDWQVVDWQHPFTWLLQEGTATYFSQQVTENIEEFIYFAYKEKDSSWLDYAKKNEYLLIKAFKEDIKKLSTVEVFKEWFSINGGKRFGMVRFGYYIGYVFLCSLIEKHGEIEAITKWKEPHYKQMATEWLDSFE